jgi:pimeloyl-ACP methyl ester carboxylesterase
VWRRWGEGSPVVLLHGGTGSWRHWIANLETLARTHAVWVPDLPSMGDSAEAPPGIDLAAYSRIIYEGLVSLVPDGKIDVVGFSFGGVNSGAIAEWLGERLRKLMLAGTAGLAPPNVPLHRMIVWRKLKEPQQIEAAHRNNLEVLMFADPRNIDDLALYLQGENAKRMRLRRRKLGGYQSLRERLPGVKGEVHAVWGSRDISALPEIDERAALVQKLHPGASVTIVDGAGHWVMYEDAPAFNRILEERL